MIELLKACLPWLERFVFHPDNGEAAIALSKRIRAVTDNAKVQEGYVIRRALKPEHCKGTDDRPFVDRGPDYLHPGEGYSAMSYLRTVPSLRIGWLTMSEAQEALSREEDAATEHNYLEAFNKFDHTIVKVTVIEEAVQDGE